MGAFELPEKSLDAQREHPARQNEKVLAFLDPDSDKQT